VALQAAQLEDRIAALMQQCDVQRDELGHRAMEASAAAAELQRLRCDSDKTAQVRW